MENSLSISISISIVSKDLVGSPRELVVREHDVVETGRSVNQHCHPLILGGDLKNLEYQRGGERARGFYKLEE